MNEQEKAAFLKEFLNNTTSFEFNDFEDDEDSKYSSSLKITSEYDLTYEDYYGS